MVSEVIIMYTSIYTDFKTTYFIRVKHETEMKTVFA